MRAFYRTVFFLAAWTLMASTAQAGGDREIGDGTLPLGILPMHSEIALDIREEARNLVGFLTHDGVKLPLREVIAHNNGDVTLLFGDLIEGVGLTGTLAPESFMGNIFLSSDPSVAFRVEIAR